MGSLGTVLILFIVVVLPLWLILHYITRWKSSRAFSKEDMRILEDLWKSSKEMQDRVETLETILNAQSKKWEKER